MIIHAIVTSDADKLASLEAWADRKNYELILVEEASDITALPQLWDIDALVFFERKALSSRASGELVRWVSLLEKCGRPMLHCKADESPWEDQLQALSLKPRTNYLPVDCGYYDHFEAAIVQRMPQRIRLTCFGESVTESEVKSLLLLGTKTWRKEEFIEVEGYGWMRADWIDMVDVKLIGECSI